MNLLLLTLDAPLMSFGASIIDNKGIIQPWPAASMLVGLLANALGWERREYQKHRDLQRRLRYAVRQDRAPRPLMDYQTVDLGQPHLLASEVGWTTWGRVEARGGAGATNTGTHIRYRDYHADAVYTVALTLTPELEVPTLHTLAEALKKPARPLFIGRKPCTPAAPLLRREAGQDLFEADSPFDALTRLPPARRVGAPTPEAGTQVLVWLDHEPQGRPSRWIPTTDQRDWHNQVFGGQRLIYETTLTLPTGGAAEGSHP
jgi:CRISPR system Cascade subunit CasD